jgi:hypothetical protein
MRSRGAEEDGRDVTAFLGRAINGDVSSVALVLVATHIGQLQSAMGAAHFQILDGFVRATSTVKSGTASQGPK